MDLSESEGGLIYYIEFQAHQSYTGDPVSKRKKKIF